MAAAVAPARGALAERTGADAVRNTPGRSVGGGRWHYHSKQKKLMRMEADEAFRMRGAVLAGLAALGLVGGLLLWCAGSRVVSELRRLVSAVRR